MQRFSVFHGSPEAILKAWHRPYADLFVGCAPVLDVGCGLGYFADLLRERGVECIGLDIDPAMVETSEARGHVARQGDHRSIRQFDVEFGGIHISHVVEHLWGEDVVELLEQCTSTLRVGGRLVIRTPNWENREVRHRMFWSDYTHRRPYNVEVLTRLLRDLGHVIDIAGAEPYGHNDLFVIATKGGAPTPSGVNPDFSRDPFPRTPWRRKALKHWLPSRLKAALRSWRDAARKLRGQQK